ncbi:glucokinase [Castellaniella caeni]|uniref:glucokinase n=1 Tax=Castellaniella caeni TaxID=266123 RepID=UPI000B0BF2FF|nr:glucokinase [Castellaniella caeni]
MMTQTVSLISPDPTYPRLVGDIGGTNARFAMIPAAGAAMTAIQTLACADYPGPAEAITAYLKAARLPSPRWCAFGIANPVSSDLVRMTNHHWQFSISALRDALGLDVLRVVNDFTALAMAIPALGPADLRQVGGGAIRAGAAIGLIGPGTGLGISGLIPCQNDYTPLAGEGGHITLAARNREEAALIDWVGNRHGHVSAERLISGQGLENLYLAHAALAGHSVEPLSAARISEQALRSTDALCLRALNSLCAFLGTVTANLALILGAQGGMYIGGGIIPKLGPFFDRSPFRARFEDKGRFQGYLGQIPTFVIQARHPALIGAARALARQAQGGDA